MSDQPAKYFRVELANAEINRLRGQLAEARDKAKDLAEGMVTYGQATKECKAQLAESQSDLRLRQECIENLRIERDELDRELAALREQLIDVRSTAENLWAEGDISLSVRRQICDGIDLPAAPAEEGGRVTIADRDVAKADRERGMAEEGET